MQQVVYLFTLMHIPYLSGYCALWRIARTPKVDPHSCGKKIFVLTVLVSCVASIGGLVGSGVRLRLRVSSSSGPASFCGVLPARFPLSRAEFEYCAGIYRAQ